MYPSIRQDIHNYVLTKRSNSVWEPIPYITLRYKWLEKPVNKLLKFLGAEFEYKHETVNAISIDRTHVYNLCITACNEYQVRTGHRPTHLIVGRDFMDRIFSSELPKKETHCYQLNTKEFLGMNLIIHPMINGLIPISLEGKEVTY